MRLALLTLFAAACQAQGPWPYLTYFGGIGADSVRAVSNDGAGGTILAGDTYSVGPPFSTAAPNYRSSPSAFVARIDAGGQLVFANVLGEGNITALATDADGNAFVTGTISNSRDFTTPGVFQPESLNSRAFIAKFSPSGEKRFATYFGSQSGVQIRALTLDAEGRPTFCGSATGNSVPLTAASLFQTEARGSASFCAQLSADGSSLLFATLLGKPSTVTSSVTTPLSAAIDADGYLLVAGSTSDSAFGTAVDPQAEDRRRTLFRSRSGERFQNLAGADLGSVASVQQVGNEVFVGTQSNGAWVSPDGGDTWRQIRGAPSGALVAHPLATRFLCVYASNQGFCSQDGGGNWRLIGTYSGLITLVPDSRTEGSFFLTSDQPSQRFGYIGLGSPAPRTNLDSLPRWLSVSPDGDRILAVVDYRLLLSEDRGATFRELAVNISRAAVAPGAPHRIYATRYALFPGQDSLVIRSDDGGAYWTDTNLDELFPGLRQLAVDPANPDIVYVVAGAGAYRSLDAGASWQLWTPPGLDNTGVQTLHFDNRDQLWAGTYQIDNGFLVKLALDQPAISWGKIFSSAGGGQLAQVRTGADGRIFFIGSTLGTDLPVTGPDLTPRLRGRTGLIGRMEPSGELGAMRNIGLAAASFDLAADGSIHLAAAGVPADLGEVGEVQGTFAGAPNDVIWLVLSPELDRVVRATWLGGEGDDTPGAISAGPDGKVRVVGATLSRRLPVSNDAFQPVFTLYNGESLIGGEGFLAIAPQ